MYISGNPKSKKAVKDGIKAGEKFTVFNPGLGGAPPIDGEVVIEGPHYPKPHSFYGKVTLKGGYIASIK